MSNANINWDGPTNNPSDPLERVLKHGSNFRLQNPQHKSMGLFIGYKKNGEGIIIPTTYTNDKEKDVFLKFVKIAFFAYEVNAYGIVSEAWMHKAEKNEPISPDVRNREDKSEVLIVTYVSEKQHVTAKSFRNLGGTALYKELNMKIEYGFWCNDRAS